MARRIEASTSRTAQMTCVSRAASSMEGDPHYHSDDTISPILLPDALRLLFRLPLARRFFTRIAAPQGIYEYVIARTKYIDAACLQALDQGFSQILIFGAGFDTRALRFQTQARQTRFFELDAPVTQQAKIGQYQQRGLIPPPNLTFIAIDFDRESLPDKLDQAGFLKGQRDLFILEGLLMYLQPESVEATFKILQAYAGAGSRVVFDTIRAAVLSADPGERDRGEKEIVEMVTAAGEGWHFGIEPGGLERFLAGYGLALLEYQSAQDLERRYFSAADGRLIAEMNHSHALVTAEWVGGFRG